MSEELLVPHALLDDFRVSLGFIKQHAGLTERSTGAGSMLL